MKAHPLLQQPCLQSYTDMAPTHEGGFHCAKCSFVVTDFRFHSDEEIVEVLRANAGKKVCGLLQPKYIQVTRHSVRAHRTPWDAVPQGMRKALQVFALAVALSFTGWGAPVGLVAQVHNQQPTLRGSVVTGRLECSQSVAGKFVKLRKGSRWVGVVTLGPDGHFEFKNLSPGRYVLVVDGQPFDIPEVKPGQVLEYAFSYSGNRVVEVPTVVPDKQMPLAGAVAVPDTSFTPVAPPDSPTNPMPTPEDPVAPPRQ